MNAMSAAGTRLRVWGTVLRLSIAERLVYRGDFALGTLMRFLPIVTQIFLWGAIFASLKQETQQDSLAGFHYSDMIAYYLLTMVSRAFSSMPGLASGIALQIRNGEVKKYLVQPIDMIGFLLLGRTAHKLVYYATAFLPFALVFYLCRGYFRNGWPDAPTLAAFAASLVMSFLLGFLLETAMGMVGFWFLEVSSLVFIYMLFSFFFSGHMFPIDFLPGAWGTFVRAMPLQYLAYFPAAVFLGKIQGDELVRGLWIQAAWVVALFVLCRLMFYYGVKRYSGYGG